MVTPGHESANKVQGPLLPGQGRRPAKTASLDIGKSEGGYQGTPRPCSAVQHSTEVLHQRKKMAFYPTRATIGGFAFVVAIGYLTLYSKKKPEATTLDVAEVGSSTASPQNTHPRN